MAQRAAPDTRLVYTRLFFTPRRREAVTGYLFALPWLLGFLGLTVGPMLFSLYASFTTYNIVTPPRWIGPGNYSFIFQHDDRFRISLANTLYYVAIKTPLVISVSLFFAIVMNMNLPGLRILRTIYYMPTVITGVAAIFLCIWVLNPQGILNLGLGLVGIAGPNWFYDPAWAKNGLIVMGLWYIGSPVHILLAGLTAVPRQLHEAAEIDGAGTWTTFRRITLPLLSPTLLFLVITNIIGAFQVFNSAFVVSMTAGTTHTPGDPGQSLLFYEVYLYVRAFTDLQMGYATALAWILFIVVMGITAVQLC